MESGVLAAIVPCTLLLHIAALRKAEKMINRPEVNQPPFKYKSAKRALNLSFPVYVRDVPLREVQSIIF